MKKFLALILCFSVILPVVLLTSCGRSLEHKDGYYYCPQNDVTYKMVTFDYTPVAIGKEYATIKEGLIDTVLYEIKDADPKEWLSTADGNLFCAIDEQVPTLEEMGIDNILVCYESVATISLATVDDPKDVEAILDILTNGDQVEYPIGDEKEEFLKLRMSSPKFPWLYYTVADVEFAIDVCEYDYPESMDDYEFRNVSKDVAVESFEEFECWYAVSSKSEEEEYVKVAEKAGIRYITLKKPEGNGVFTDYVIYIFEEERSSEECVATVVSNYKNGSKTESELKEMLGQPRKSNTINVVKYNYGRFFLYDRVSGKCVKAGDLLDSYVNRVPNESEAE